MPKFYIGVRQRESNNKSERASFGLYKMPSYFMCVCVEVRQGASSCNYIQGSQAGGRQQECRVKERERMREREERGLLYSKTTHLHMYMQRVLREGEEREEDHVLATRNTFHM